MATITSLPHELLIYLRDRFGHEFYAHYAFVRINAAEMNYAIQLGEKVGGQLPDEWSDINQMAFAAFDHQGETQCNEMSGWWHTRGCRSVNLNIQMGSGTPRIRYANISKSNLCNIYYKRCKISIINFKLQNFNHQSYIFKMVIRTSSRLLRQLCWYVR